MTARHLRPGTLLGFVGAIPSVVGCPVIPPASQWGPTDVGCLDHWSLNHLGSGLLLGEALGEESFLPSMAALIGWEAVEPSFWSSETAHNQVCDVAVGGLGWLASLAVGQ